MRNLIFFLLGFLFVLIIGLASQAHSYEVQGLPVDLTGTVPESGTLLITFEDNEIPIFVQEILVIFHVYDADIDDEGRIELNGEPWEPLWPSPTEDGTVTPQTFKTSPDRWRLRNFIEFFHDRTMGFRVDAVDIGYSFLTGATVEKVPGGKVKLAWDPVIDPGLGGYNVYYKVGTSGVSPFDGTHAAQGPSPIRIPIAVFGGVTDHHLDVPFFDFNEWWPANKPDEAYWFAVKAFNTAEWWDEDAGVTRYIRESEFSNVVALSFQPEPDAPSGVTVFLSGVTP